MIYFFILSSILFSAFAQTESSALESASSVDPLTCNIDKDELAKMKKSAEELHEYMKKKIERKEGTFAIVKLNEDKFWLISEDGSIAILAMNGEKRLNYDAELHFGREFYGIGGITNYRGVTHFRATHLYEAHEFFKNEKFKASPGLYNFTRIQSPTGDKLTMDDNFFVALGPTIDTGTKNTKIKFGVFMGGNLFMRNDNLGLEAAPTLYMKVSFR